MKQPNGNDFKGLERKSTPPKKKFSSMKEEMLPRLKRVQAVTTELGNRMYILCFKTFVSMLIHYIKFLSSLESCLMKNMPIGNN